MRIGISGVIPGGKNSGFTLIEVLVAAFVLAIGVLGIAGLQTTGVRNNQSALQRTQATFLASQYAEIVRSNTTQEQNGYFGDTADDGSDFSTDSPPSEVAACFSASGCSAAQMAQTDLAGWADDVTSSLPAGVATVERVNDIYTVTINWADNRESVTDFSNFGDGDGVDQARLETGFQMSFKP